MKKELDYFYVDGSYGFDQDDFSNPVMKMGGCAAVTACDCFIYFKKYFGIESVYPGDTERITRGDYIAFSNAVKPYLHPRITGINKTQTYIDGVNSYLKSVNETRISLSAVEGDADLETAKAEIIKQIDCGIPIAYLMLKHRGCDPHTVSIS